MVIQSAPALLETRTQPVTGITRRTTKNSLFFVSARTIKRHHHHQKNRQCTIRVTVRASSHVLYLVSLAESTKPKQVYVNKLDFVSERTIKDIIIFSNLYTVRAQTGI
jgi:hypothetical protein